jgi:hypothetical protein
MSSFARWQSAIAMLWLECAGNALDSRGLVFGRAWTEQSTPNKGSLMHSMCMGPV